MNGGVEQRKMEDAFELQMPGPTGSDLWWISFLLDQNHPAYITFQTPTQLMSPRHSGMSPT